MENVGDRSRERKLPDGRTIVYHLKIIQEPQRARACGSGAKSSADRRPLDPPPVVQLKISGNEGPNIPLKDVTFVYNSNFFILVTLEAAEPANLPNTSTKSGTAPAASAPSVPEMTGVIVSGIMYLDRPCQAGYFPFPDLSVRHEGLYRLKFNLYEEIRESSMFYQTFPGVHYRLDVKSQPFEVFSAKKFPGLMPSTPISQSLAEQGVRLRNRKEVRSKRQDKEAALQMLAQQPTVVEAPTAMDTTDEADQYFIRPPHGEPQLSTGHFTLPSMTNSLNRLPLEGTVAKPMMNVDLAGGFGDMRFMNDRSNMTIPENKERDGFSFLVPPMGHGQMRTSMTPWYRPTWPSPETLEQGDNRPTLTAAFESQQQQQQQQQQPMIANSQVLPAAPMTRYHQPPVESPTLSIPPIRRAGSPSPQYRMAQHGQQRGNVETSSADRRPSLPGITELISPVYNRSSSPMRYRYGGGAGAACNSNVSHGNIRGNGDGNNNFYGSEGGQCHAQTGRSPCRQSPLPPRPIALGSTSLTGNPATGQVPSSASRIGVDMGCAGPEFTASSDVSLADTVATDFSGHLPQPAHIMAGASVSKHRSPKPPSSDDLSMRGLYGAPKMLPAAQSACHYPSPVHDHNQHGYRDAFSMPTPTYNNAVSPLNASSTMSNATYKRAHFEAFEGSDERDSKDSSLLAYLPYNPQPQQQQERQASSEAAARAPVSQPLASSSLSYLRPQNRENGVPFDVDVGIY